MLSLSKSKSVVGLDVETGSIAATELSMNGHASVSRYGLMPLDPGIFREGEVADPDALAACLKELFSREKLSKTVRLGIANQRVAVRTLRLPRIENDAELETAIRFQAQDHIPMPMEQAVLDWQVVHSPLDAADNAQMSVVVVAARRDMLDGVMGAMRQAGLRPEGIDHSAFGMIRALTGEPTVPVGAAAYVDAPSDGATETQPLPEADAAPADAATTEVSGMPVTARLFCNLGDVTNLAVARASTCLFTRIASFGIEGMAQSLAERRQLTLEHARQWLAHVGLETPPEQIEGEAELVSTTRTVLTDGAAKLADELRRSLDYYGAQEDAVAIDGVVVCGPGTTIPGLVAHLERDLGYPFKTARPQALAGLDDAAAARLTLSYGLALEG
jgi:type IV pilus assembly protein PilM